MRYVLVYYGGSMPQTPAQQARVMKQWTSWYTKLGPAIIDPGNPFGPVTRIDSDGNVARGAVGRRASGYSIIEAPSLAAATKIARGCPVIKGGGAQLAVYETFNVM